MLWAAHFVIGSVATGQSVLRAPDCFAVPARNERRLLTSPVLPNLQFGSHEYKHL
jgi:hypothetical protein